jgi:predicted O-methyltransferase YrrM
MRLRAGFVLALLSFPALAQNPARDRDPYTKKLAPYVASPGRVVDMMLEMARIKPGETLYDLGSGDGRLLIAAAEKYKAKAVGIEISPSLVTAASEEIRKAGLADRARVIQGDVLQADLSPADVVTIYMDTAANAKLRPLLEKYLKPGARVVSHDAEVPGWKPARIEKTAEGDGHTIYLYQIPAK